jgi:hypothetical protein
MGILKGEVAVGDIGVGHAVAVILE